MRDERKRRPAGKKPRRAKFTRQKQNPSAQPRDISIPTRLRRVSTADDLIAVMDDRAFHLEDKFDTRRLEGIREHIRRRRRAGKVPMACTHCGKVLYFDVEPDGPVFCDRFCKRHYEADLRLLVSPADAQSKDGERPASATVSTLSPSSPDEVLEWMNERHFVVSEAGKVMVVTDEEDPVVKRRVLKRSSFSDFRNLYSNRFVDATEAGGKRKTLAEYWLTHARRRQYSGIVCAPGRETPGFFNLWRSFSVNPSPGDWSLMEAHIRENICGGNRELYRYVRRWMAFAVQHPDRLPEVALVLRGKQGTGKGVFARELGSLFGQHFLHISQARHLAGHFNAHLQDAVLVFADEAFLVGDKQAEGTLKMLVTEPELVIEQKGKDVTRTRNLIHLIVASNHDWVIPAAAEERRFCVLDVADAQAQNHTYFGALVRQMNEGGRAAMLHDLLDEDLSNFNVRHFPVTAALQDQKRQSMSPFAQWWFEKLDDGQLVASDDKWAEEVVREDVVQAWNAHADRKWSSQDVRNALAKLLPEGHPKDGPRRAGADGKRSRTWTLPSLEDCRNHFERLFGSRFEWSPIEK
jgi:hypothetical protein